MVKNKKIVPNLFLFLQTLLLLSSLWRILSYNFQWITLYGYSGFFCFGFTNLLMNIFIHFFCLLFWYRINYPILNYAQKLSIIAHTSKVQSSIQTASMFAANTTNAVTRSAKSRYGNKDDNSRW